MELRSISTVLLPAPARAEARPQPRPANEAPEKEKEKEKEEKTPVEGAPCGQDAAPPAAESASPAPSPAPSNMHARRRAWNLAHPSPEPPAAPAPEATGEPANAARPVAPPAPPLPPQAATPLPVHLLRRLAMAEAPAIRAPLPEPEPPRRPSVQDALESAHPLRRRLLELAEAEAPSEPERPAIEIDEPRLETIERALFAPPPVARGEAVAPPRPEPAPAAPAPPVAPADPSLAPRAPQAELRPAAEAAPAREPSATSWLADSIVRQVRLHLRPGLADLRLRLDPPGLGELRIRFVLENRRLRARVTATDPVTAGLVRERVADLHAAMRDAGIDVATLDVDAGSLRERADDPSDHDGAPRPRADASVAAPPADDAPAPRRTTGVLDITV